MKLNLEYGSYIMKLNLEVWIMYNKPNLEYGSCIMKLNLGNGLCMMKLNPEYGSYIMKLNLEIWITYNKTKPIVLILYNEA